MTPWHEDQVGYLYPDPAHDYVGAVAACTSIAQLKKAIEPWKRLAPDAWRTITCIKGAEAAKEMLWAIRHRRSKKYAMAVNEIAGDVLVPAVMLHISLMADHFKAPWGTAFKKAVEFKGIELREDGWHLAPLERSIHGKEESCGKSSPRRSSRKASSSEEASSPSDETGGTPSS